MSITPEAGRAIIRELDHLVADLCHVLGALEVTAYRHEHSYRYTVRARWPGLTVWTGLDDDEVARLVVPVHTPGAVMRALLVELVRRFRLELDLELADQPIYVAVLESLRR